METERQSQLDSSRPITSDHEGGSNKGDASSDKKIGKLANKRTTSINPSDLSLNIKDPQRASKVKKPTKKIVKYESDSMDEEEFQDYFTNPIKRKEFDRQRKRQQMKEMHSITSFTLGNFGIRNVQALKEALPPYPENTEGQLNDATKNYATVSLCCMSVTNPFRNKIIQIVAVSPWFDRFILLVIMVNCIFLAMDQEVDFVTDNGELIDNTFLVIYTFEMIFKIIALGFFMRPHSYLRDNWNLMDFVVVILGWLGFVLEGDNIQAIKVIRMLRPLRTINQIPNMSSLVSTILNSLPIVFDVMILFGFALVMLGTVATQLLGGALQNRCAVTWEDGTQIFKLGPLKQMLYCQSNEDCTRAQPELVTNSTCQYYGNPFQGTYSFDNILISMMNIFQVITLEGWTDMMYIVRDAQNTYNYDLFFCICVIFGSFVILNLMIAVQASYLDKAFDEEDAQNKEKREKMELRKRLLQEQEESKYGGDEFEQEEEVKSIDQHQQETNPNSDNPRNKKKVKKCCQCSAPPCWITFQKKVRYFVEPPEGVKNRFDQFIMVMILLNTVFLASEFYDEPDWLFQLQGVGNFVFTAVFALEMIIKLIGLGFKDYFKQGFNVFDCFIVIMSLVDMVLPGEDSSLAVLKAFRLLRIFKIIRSWESLRKLLSTVLESLTAITNLGILILLYLFITALLTKQFYSGQLLDSDGNPSRYSFSKTGDALVTAFIILTGENWNEVMVQTISQQNSFTPAIFFIIVEVIGNFMLLNLFLAILLKSISNDPPPEEAKAENPITSQMTGNSQEQNVSSKSIKVNEKINNDNSFVLNSTNSNIEAQFEEIKRQLILFAEGAYKAKDQQSKNHLSSNQIDDSNSAAYVSDASVPQNQIPQEVKEFNTEQVEESQQASNNRSLFIFEQDNPIRVFFKNLIHSNYFAGFIYHMIAFNSLLLILQTPDLTDSYQQDSMELMLNLISYVFIAECLVKIIAHGFYFGEKTYLKDSWNILDFVIVFFSILTYILDAVVETDISFIRGFRALRALRPLRVVSKNEGIKTVVNALLKSIPSLIHVMLIVLLFLLVFGILGIQFFKGQLGQCNDQPDVNEWKANCTGNFTTYKMLANGTEIELNLEREWIVPFNNYDNILSSMLAFYEISGLEMWPSKMYAAIDSVALDHGPVLNNKPGISGVFVLYIFIVTFFIMNLFVSVIVDKFNDEIKKRQGSDNFTPEQKEWVKIQRLLVLTNPKVIPVEPINSFRLHCFKIVQSQAFEYTIMIAIIVNTIFMCIDYYGKPQELDKILEDANYAFVIVFILELVLKILAYGFKYYWYVNWNKFDFIIVILTLIALDERMLKEQLNINVTALRIIRISRLLRMVKTSQGLRTLLKTLLMSIGNIINTAMLLFLILFTFSVAGMSLFGMIPIDKGYEFINKNINFSNFYLSFMTLFRAATGESWNGIMHDDFAEQGIISIFFWMFFILIAKLVFLNVFIAVIGESFRDNQSTENENDILAIKKKDIKAFQNMWAKYNPMGELYMKTIRLPDFLRELPPPLGFQGIRIEETKLNKIIFCLNIRDHYGRVYYPEVMWAIFHSVAGMNDEKVLNCEQVLNILKLVKIKYKGLSKQGGGKMNLDKLCGNKYYRKELTAAKYIQAMKIYNRWKNFKNDKKRLRKQKEHMEKHHRKIIEENQDQTMPATAPAQVQQLRLEKIQANIQANRSEQQNLSRDQSMRQKASDFNDRTMKMNFNQDNSYFNRGDMSLNQSELMSDRGSDFSGERNPQTTRDNRLQVLKKNPVQANPGHRQKRWN